jgi:opacity protein-like surface antigen
VFLITPAVSLAGDAYVKLGITVHPDLGDFSNRWFFSGGSDWGFRPQAFWGIEFQGAYRSEEEGGIKVTQVPANVLFNLKWKSEEEGVRPYAGGGLGLISSYVKVEGFGDEENEWIKDAGFQFMGGVEFNRAFAVEFLGQRVFDDDADWFWSVLFGLRF